MKVLVACEYFGIVRDAFSKRGHDAWSCDLLPTEKLGNHLQIDVLEIINQDWDLMIAHPPCTALTSAGRWYYRDKVEETIRGAAFFMELVNAPIAKICIENPAGIMSTFYRKPDQCVDPYFFGEPQRKRTCLWLKNLPKLNGLVEVARNKKAFEPNPVYVDYTGKKRYFTDAIAGNKDGRHHRSKSFESIAQAMAEQWG